MQYLLLIYANEAKSDAMMADADVRTKYLQGYGEFTGAIKASGEFIAGEALERTPSARAVRVREGKVLATDGPFAETREALGGFYLVEAESLERAVEIASKIPTAKHGTIEVRPIFDWEKDSM